jgi:hypothetical protein
LGSGNKSRKLASCDFCLGSGGSDLASRQCLPLLINLCSEPRDAKATLCGYCQFHWQTLILIIFASPVTFALTLLIYPSSLAPPVTVELCARIALMVSLLPDFPFSFHPSTSNVASSLSPRRRSQILGQARLRPCRNPRQGEQRCQDDCAVRTTAIFFLIP